MQSKIAASLVAAAILTSCSTVTQDTPHQAGRTFDPIQRAAPNPDQAKASTRLVLLGTFGGPGGNADRAGIATLLVSHGRYYLVDAGIGVDRQLVRAGYSERDVRTIFLTHLHDDHTAGLPGLATFAYTLRNAGITVFGPPNTDKLINGIIAYMMPNAAIRAQEQQVRPPGSFLTGTPVGPGTVFSDGTVTVKAVANSHYHFDRQDGVAGDTSYSYRFETPDRVVVFTGDTAPSEAVENLAHQADVLVAEMMTSADVAQVPADIAAHMVRDHLSPTQVGTLASRAGVRTLVLSHTRKVTDADLAEIRSQFAGRIVFGKDLDQI